MDEKKETNKKIKINKQTKIYKETKIKKGKVGKVWFKKTGPKRRVQKDGSKKRGPK